jgi:hypothetical protein
MTTPEKLKLGRAFFATVEKSIGYSVTDHIIDLFFDNSAKLNFSDDDCLNVGNAIRADKGLPPVAKWWTDDIAQRYDVMRESPLASLDPEQSICGGLATDD